MGRIEKKSLRAPGLRNQNGQGTVEYVLILVVTISLILALTARIFKPFQKFVDEGMGTYVSCLLETGDLPKLNSEEEGLGCKMPSFEDIAKGGNGSGNGSSASNDPTKNGANAAGAVDGANGGSGGGSSGGGTYAGSASRGKGGNKFIRNFKSRSGNSDGALGGSSKETVSENPDGAAGNGFFKTRGGNFYAYQQNRRKQVNYRPVTGYLPQEIQRKLKRAETGGVRVVANDEGLSPAVKKVVLKPQAAKAEKQIEIEPLTAGNFMRYLIIAAIIIALVIFIGGQALQFSKSD